VLITDDVASAPPEGHDERRGIAGSVGECHLAGAAAERGDPIDEVERLATLANSRTRSHGVAFGGCTLPGADHPLFEVPEGQMSIGLGIHGEPGVRDVPLQSAPDLAVTLAAPLLAERPADAGRAAVILNGLGSVKYEELYVLFGYVVDHLEAQGIEVVDPECGEFVTSLDMAGVSLTIMWLDDELEELWKAPASSPAFRKGHFAARSSGAQRTRGESATTSAARAAVVEATPASRAAATVARRLLRAARDTVAAHVEELGELDAVAGDGDHGIGMLRGLTAAVEASAGADEATGVRELLQAAGDAWSEVAGGTSGALWGAALAQLGASLGSPDEFTASDVADAVSAARARIAELGGADLGDKTMLDAVAPYAETLTDRVRAGADLRSALTDAAAAARAAAEATAPMTPRRGRARPLAERSIGHPDPGATSFALIADAVAAAAASEDPEEAE